MRPSKLRMSAFGPYAGEVILNMDELGTQGLYLITGDTGAGKTTIFDALCFALFGKASGDNRNDSSLFRSKYADPDVLTEVELWFLHGNKEYRVKRNPEYLRPAKRGTGMTSQSADAQLYLPDGRVITKVRDVTEAVEGILGINRDQFAQISMLAQGDFLKLLLAETKERQVIFRDLFNTGYYMRLQAGLLDKKKEIYVQLEDARKSVNQYIAGIQVDEDSCLSLEVDEAKKGLKTTGDTLELLNKLIEQDTASKQEIQTKLTEITKLLGTVNANIGAAEALENTRRSLETAREQLVAMLPEENNAKSYFEQAKSNLSGKDALTAEAAQIDAKLPDYDTFDAIISSLAAREKELKSDVAALDKYDSELNNKKEEIELFRKEQAAYTDVSVAIEKIRNDLEKVDNDRAELNELIEETKSYEAADKAFVAAQEEYKEVDKAFNQKRQLFNSKDQAFRDGLAGILASKLEDNMACPVCGSTEHPHKASLLASVPTEDELKEAEAELESVRERLNIKLSDVTGKKAVKEEKESGLKKKTLLRWGVDDIKAIESCCNEDYKKLATRRNELTAQLESENAKVNRKAKVDEAIAGCEEAILSLNDVISTLKAKISANNAKIEENNAQANSLRKTLAYESKRAACKKSDELKQAAVNLQKYYDDAQRKLNELEEGIAGIKSQIEGFERTIAESRAVDLEAERKEKGLLDANQSKLIEDLQGITTRVQTNEVILRNIESQSKKLVDIEKQYQWVCALSDTANGNLSGKEKISLETYIQTTYFDRVIERANMRLMTMSDGQYELMRQSEASNTKSKSGLELGVIDHYNGSQRSVRTLSGGESFMASLSLALGLSDEIQSSAGGIQIDTMFVDEGFGSLDPDALDLAYKALAGLTEGNKLVGIISHVAELKEKIDKQIIVTKEKSGGSFAKINS